MYYVCIENNQIVSILNYQPSVPGSVSITEISDNEYNLIENKTHYFNVATKKVEPLTESQILEQQTYNENSERKEFLNSTDWKILRHLREKTLGLETSMTEEEFIELENQRQTIAKSITG